MNQLFTQLKQQFAFNKWLQNIAAWLVFLVVFGLTAQTDGDGSFLEAIIVIVLLVLLFAIPVYITNLVLLPIFRQGRRWLAFFLYLVTILFFAWAGEEMVKAGCKFICYFLSCSEDMKDISFGDATNLFGTNLLSTLIGLVLRIARDNVIENSKNQEAELQLLKGQLNPHFLFNTLNNLYGLSVIKSDKLPGLMLKLSELLRYSLYQTKDRLVPLSHEMTYLQNYLELERLRLDDEIELSLTIKGEPATMVIAPMLLIVFVENAFKHFGTSRGTTAFIRININILDDQIQFWCENSKDPQAIVSPREQNASGIGLTNVRQRLALLYPGLYKLDVLNNNTTFKVALELHHLSTSTPV